MPKISLFLLLESTLQVWFTRFMFSIFSNCLLIGCSCCSTLHLLFSKARLNLVHFAMILLLSIQKIEYCSKMCHYKLDLMQGRSNHLIVQQIIRSLSFSPLIDYFTSPLKFSILGTAIHWLLQSAIYFIIPPDLNIVHLKFFLHVIIWHVIIHYDLFCLFFRHIISNLH